MKISIILTGQLDYSEALELQEQLYSLRLNNAVGDLLIITEHNPVITIGKSGNTHNILINEEKLKKKGVAIYRVCRGGDVTYHGPGQIIGYPIISLSNFNRVDIHHYIFQLEELFIRLLQEQYSLAASRDPDHRGVWVGMNKIVALGCSLRKNITMHGFAFNVNPILEHYDWIVPCGIAKRGVTSLEKELGFTNDTEFVITQVIEYFTKVFKFKVENIIKWC